ncbi:MAG: hypothetical protein OJF49_002876 [Ktedonobacterales bacterium]|nr:MAG: hypothetical protein OJF49_002876 [Ktedonobacterales bacterium]
MLVGISIERGLFMVSFLRRRLYVGFLFALMALAGCGVTAVSAADCSSLGGSPGTKTSGPITIATDHTTYAANAPLVVTVTNTLSTSIYAPDHAADCSILALRSVAAGQSTPPNFQYGCALGIATRLIEIGAGKSYTATIHPGYLHEGTFAPGTYQLALAYFPTNSFSDGNRTVIYSQTITISTCGAATPVKPGAGSTAQPASGTPVQVSATKP